MQIGSFRIHLAPLTNVGLFLVDSYGSLPFRINLPFGPLKGVDHRQLLVHLALQIVF